MSPALRWKLTQALQAHKALSLLNGSRHSESLDPDSPILSQLAQAASEDELRYALGLSSYTTGKGKVDMKDTNIRPIEVFMCSVVRIPAPQILSARQAVGQALLPLVPLCTSSQIHISRPSCKLPGPSG